MKAPKLSWFKLREQGETHLVARSKMLEYDQALIWVTLALMLFGIVMVYSASIALPDSP